MGSGEFELIARHFTRPTQRTDVVLGIGDDAAVLHLPQGCELAAATDTLVEGRHFLPGIEAASVGHQSLAVNLSDLAAMGAEPAWALLALSLPEADETWLRGFSAGLHELAARFGVALVGGDTVRGPRVVTVTVLGHIERGTALCRNGARPGDRIYLSGAPGEAAAGLELLRSGHRERSPVLVRRQMYAEPRLALGRGLRGLASAAMDVSDGVLGDLAKLCAASGVAAELALEQLPLSDELLRFFERDAAEEFVLNGGDDYELLFTVPSARAAALQLLAGSQVAMTCIGKIVEGQGVTCLRAGERVATGERSHDHFR